MTPRLLDVAAAAEYLSTTEAALKKKVTRREIPFVRVGKRAIRFDVRQLDDWIDEHTVEAAR